VTKDLRRQIAAFFEADAHGAAAAYLFGSVARGEATAASDVDVAVLFDEAPEPVLSGAALTLEGDVERHIGRAVDLVNLNCAPADLVHRVLRDGVIVFDLNRSRRLRFEVTRRNEFFDLERVRRRYRQGVRPSSPRGVMTDPELVQKKLAQNMAGFRNILVRGYDDVDLSIVRDIVAHHLDDLIAFTAAIRAIIRNTTDQVRPADWFRAYFTAGREIVNVVPWPRVLSAAMDPPFCTLVGVESADRTSVGPTYENWF
jgi:predicted nucleotidyltransferase